MRGPVAHNGEQDGQERPVMHHHTTKNQQENNVTKGFRISAILAGALILGLGAVHFSSAAAHRTAVAPTVSERHVVITGLDQAGSTALLFSPKYLDVYVGDIVTWRMSQAVEPHTVTFGPETLLKQLSKDVVMPVAQKSGPPLLAIDPRAVERTPGSVYDGSGYFNSGLLSKKGQEWSISFSKPGTYRYICLIHGESMGGVVVVHPRPGAGKLYIVQAGDGEAAANDRTNTTESTMFFPRALTIHVGDTVEWIGGFHTVTFGPDSLRHRLENSVFVQARGKNGESTLAINPQIAFPSGGSTYDGTGYVNSGLLFMLAGKNTPPIYKLTFTRPGTYEYDCLLHKGMDGTITVLPKGA